MWLSKRRKQERDMHDERLARKRQVYIYLDASREAQKMTRRGYVSMQTGIRECEVMGKCSAEWECRAKNGAVREKGECSVPIRDEIMKARRKNSRSKLHLKEQHETDR